MTPSTILTVATTVGGYVLTLLIIPRVLLSRREAGATLAWLLTIVFLPYLGAALFLLIGRTRVRRRTRRRRRARLELQRHVGEIAGEAPHEPEPAALSGLPPAARDVAALTCAVSGDPLLAGNRVDVFVAGQAAYDAMEAAIRSARHHVHFMSYIYRTDATGQRFRDLLVEKAREGVQVRLLLDGVGSIAVRSSFVRPLVEAGGHFAEFMPVLRFRPRWRPNLRNHRKILVVDGRLGFAGGLNVGDEYADRDPEVGRWRDTHLRLEGPAVRRLQEVFLEDWYYATDDDVAAPEHFPATPARGPELVQVVDSGPDRSHSPIQAIVFSAVNRATRRVWVTTAYFVPDPPLLLALKTAAWRGVDVRVLVPGRSDLPLVQLAGRAYYAELLEAGVRIFEYQRAILHAKTLVVDGCWSTIGSANMDIRSFELNYEVNVQVAGTTFAERLESVFRRDVASAHELTLADVRARPRPVRMAESLARVLSPVL